MNPGPELHKKVVSPLVWKQLTHLMQLPVLRDFRLAGGTAIALQCGHRVSIDLDLFAERTFSPRLLATSLAQAFPGFMIDQMQPHGISGHQQATKVDLYYMGSFLYPAQKVAAIRLADLRDIAAMKLECILSRKERKDYHDIAELLKKAPLATWIAEFQKKYPYYQARTVVDHLLKVSEANASLVPQMLSVVTWEQVKEQVYAATKAFLLTIKEKEEQAAIEREKKWNELLRNQKKNR